MRAYSQRLDRKPKRAAYYAACYIICYVSLVPDGDSRLRVNSLG